MSLRTRFAPLLVALTLPACDDFSPTGSWLFTIEAAPDPDCFVAIDHNFSGATVPDDPDQPPSDWVEEHQESFSPEQVWGEILEGADGSALLVIDGRTLPGVWVDGQWEFEWTVYADDQEGDEHDSGYEYSESFEDQETTRVRGVLGDGTFGGSWSDTSASSAVYSESDLFSSNAVGFSRGRIPADRWLTPAPGQDGVENWGQDVQCEDPECSLVRDLTCVVERNLSAVRYEGGGGEPAVDVSASGQDSGDQFDALGGGDQEVR